MVRDFDSKAAKTIFALIRERDKSSDLIGVYVIRHPYLDGPCFAMRYKIGDRIAQSEYVTTEEMVEKIYNGDLADAECIAESILFMRSSFESQIRNQH